MGDLIIIIIIIIIIITIIITRHVRLQTIERCPFPKKCQILFLCTLGKYCPNLVKIGTGKQTLELTQASYGKKKKKKRKKKCSK